jgi:hypothetical protein
MKGWLRKALHGSAAVAIVCAIVAIEFGSHGRRNTVTYSLLLAMLYFAVRWDRLETILASVAPDDGVLVLFSTARWQFQRRTRNRTWR